MEEEKREIGRYLSPPPHTWRRGRRINASPQGPPSQGRWRCGVQTFLLNLNSRIEQIAKFYFYFNEKKFCFLILCGIYTVVLPGREERREARADSTIDADDCWMINIKVRGTFYHSPPTSWKLKHRN